MRKSRIRLFAATGAALAALALTACEDGTGTEDEGAGTGTSQPSASATTDTPSDSAKAPSKEDTTANDPAQAGGGKNGGNKGAGGSGTGTGTGTSTGDKDDNAPENRVSCNGSNTTVDARPVPRPVNHMLITVKNSGSKTCDLTYYPVLRFDEMQWVPQPIEASKPQAVVTLAPGETAYAGVLLSAADGSGDGGDTAHKLTVAFQGRTPNSDGGPSAVPGLPADGVYYDSSMAVTYWQQSMADALTY
ncbi:DUF4232 domain-containing protein [Streptomyces sp. NPDC048584]|uniref:DUF4232 domain-containing protein n=1 Tax=Streptomyces sp. NPDC048584 TaxID=3365573 RepID=UPI00371AF300